MCHSIASTGSLLPMVCFRLMDALTSQHCGQSPCFAPKQLGTDTKQSIVQREQSVNSQLPVSPEYLTSPQTV